MRICIYSNTLSAKQITLYTMRRIIVLIITILTIANNVKGQPQAIWQLLTDGSIARWAYSGGDEFNGTSLDLNKWYTCEDGWNREHGNELQYYLDDNVVLDNGILKLIAKEEPGYYNVWRFNGGAHIEQKYFNYTSGWIQSKQKFKYGLFEIRIKLPEGKGLWPAFWLYGANPNEEFDIFEYKGETPNKIHIDMHCPSGCQNFGGWITTNGNFSNGFNVIMGEWGPNATFWYLNGQEFAGWFGNLYYQSSVRANLAVSNNDCDDWWCIGPDNTTPFPSIFEIDYIRIWTRLDCEQNITIENYSQTNTDPTVITGNQITMGGNNGNAHIQSGQYLNLIATDVIKLKQGFVAESGSKFSAKIIDCPSISKNDEFIEEKDSVLHVVSKLDSDSLQQVQTKSTVENPTHYITKIYPNPTDGKIDIEFVGKTERKIKIALTNSTGIIVFVQDNILENKISIDISNLAKGVYILTGYFGDSTVSEKIILK